MLRPNHLDNFGTNLTSGTSASDTTSPVNSVPSIDAPFWVAFDATNINSHYERKLITSKTATNILHSALAYDHTTAEEVRIVNPSEEFDAIYQPPQGHLINGKISVTDAAGITVAIKTLAGADPSETDPVHVRIGDSVHTLTAALSVTAADGTNWFSSGSAELAAKAVDYFAYLGYNATDGVVIGFARVPYASKYDQFSTSSTDDNYCKISTITTAATTDNYEVIGRFEATLSAGAGYTWTVPTFAPETLIQRPIYETRVLTWDPTHSGYSVNPTYASTPAYILRLRTMFIETELSGSGTSNSTSTSFTMPFRARATLAAYPCFVQNNGTNSLGRAQTTANSNSLAFKIDASGNSFTGSGSKYTAPAGIAIQIL